MIIDQVLADDFVLSEILDSLEASEALCVLFLAETLLKLLLHIWKIINYVFPALWEKYGCVIVSIPVRELLTPSIEVQLL